MKSAPPIAFGTSGLRGEATGFTPERIAAYVGAFLEVAAAEAADRRVFVGTDLRASSPAIAGAVVAALAASGREPVYAGAVPTPALAAYAIARGCPAIMVTGSHIPARYNGLKFYRPDGELLKADEEPMRRRAEALAGEAEPAPMALPPADPEIGRSYGARYTENFAPDALAGLRIGVFTHSAVGRDGLLAILGALGADCVAYGRSERFVAVDTEAVATGDLAEARAQIAAQRLDAVVSTDGDGDRPLVIEETGHQINGDVLGALAAAALGIGTIVTPLTSTSAIELSGWFSTVVRTRIGSPYVVAAMAEAGGVDPLAGFEANGGFILGTTLALARGPLERLPTRDAVLPLVAVLAAARERGLTLSRLAATLPARVMKADRIEDVSPVLGTAFLASLAQSAEARAALDPRLAHPLGVDTRDGVRLSLEGGDIVHFRQSGNAPEMRCYVETDAAGPTERLLAQMTEKLKHRLAAHG